MARVKELSGIILLEYDVNGVLNNGTGNSILTPLSGECDELLQQFHRVDEGLGIDGKWAGGSVTGVCRGWGSTKVSRKVTKILT